MTSFTCVELNMWQLWTGFDTCKREHVITTTCVKWKVCSRTTFSTTPTIPFSACGNNSHNTHYFAKSQIGEGWNFHRVVLFPWIHVHLPYISRRINVCSIVFVECIMCFGEVKEASSSSSQHRSLMRHLLTLRNWRELVLRVYGTLTFWAPETPDLMVTLIS
jgi:hypothetical protein